MAAIAAPRRVIAIGASAGGVAALPTLTSALPADLDAAVLIVLHVGMHASTLPQLLAARSALPVRHARDGEAILRGHVYVAPPDRHLLVVRDRLALSHGPKEHHTRPAIDPLFRSLAMFWGARAIGVVLTGHLDDGTAGLQGIKASGGIAIVQDPDDAVAPEMPESARRYVEVDHMVPIADMGSLLVRLVREPADARHGAPAALATAEERARGGSMSAVERLGSPSVYTCPDCHGTLFELECAAPQRFRCHTGHAFSARSLGAGLAASTEDALWNAVRTLHEHEALLRALAQADRAAGDGPSAERLLVAAERARSDAATLGAMTERSNDIANG